ncbi:MAG: RluA family pseudouridine synthase [Anaerococcus sp.]|nr:RluA family pseudouridine synthase [Anaerococcus sp.]
MKYISLIVDENIHTRKFLRKKGYSNRASEKILKNGYYLNDILVSKSRQLKTGDKVKIIIKEEDLDYEPIKEELKILYEDDHTLVINKDPGISVNSKNQISLANHLAYYFLKKGIRSKIRLVNRLDMNTSGIMIVAKNKFAQSYYQDEIEQGKIEKKYLALVESDLDIDRLVKLGILYDKDQKKYLVDNKGKVAKTIFKTKRIYNNKALVEAKILTGKTHQIRLSLSYLGYPIIGDKLYGSRVEIDRFLLHSYFLSFRPFLGEENIKIVDYPEFESFLRVL